MADIPPFIDLFAFHLAARLFDSERIKDALTKSHSLRWRSRWEHIRVDASRTPHLYFIDVSFYFGRNRNNHKPQVELCFGALISRPGKNDSCQEALYVQSSPWNLSDLESYTSNTGICVQETGPEGMAKIVASSLANLKTAHISEYHFNSNSGNNPQVKVCIEIEHAILNEGVKLLLHAPQLEADGVVGPVALSMLMQTLIQNDDDRIDINLHTDKNFCDDERNFISWWTAKGWDHTHEYDSSENAELLKTNLQIVSTVSARAEPLEACEHDQTVMEEKQSCVDNTDERDVLTVDCSSSKTTIANKRPGVLHGAVRNKKRKKGKLTFGQI
jgi:hypothetical protein